MPQFIVTATRVTTYEVDAATPEDAIDKMIDGDGIEIDNETTCIHAEGPETNDLTVPIATAERTP